MNVKKVTTRKAWNDNDVKQLLDVYSVFLTNQLNLIKYTKASKVRELALLQERSKGSIECKMMNVSAVLADLNQPWVNGYKPLSNYNKALKDQVIDYYKLSFLQGVA